MTRMLTKASSKDKGKNSSRQPFFGRSGSKKEMPFFQAKLAVNAPHDIYEKEADAMADRVVNRKPVSGADVQRKCSECEAEEKEEEKAQPKLERNSGDLQMKTSEEEEEPLQRKHGESGQLRSAPPSLSSSLKNSRGRGKLLPQSTRRRMEHSFGADFSKVNIHTDSNAVQMSRDLHAQAFTHGHDIYFNQGKFDPSTKPGKHLLAHELTHVIQQKGFVQRQEEPGSEGTVDNGKATDENLLEGYTQCDFIDERISHEAQFALYHLYKRKGLARANALSMLGAVKDGQLQGIFKEDLGKPAMMAQRHGTVWWELIPKGQGAFVFEPEQPPMMVFKINIANNRDALANALQSAWEASAVGQLAIIIPPPSFEVCPLMPPPPPPPEPEPGPEPEPEEKCPPGLEYDPDTDLCILPGKIKTECTASEMDRTFQQHEDSCAGIKMAIDIVCAGGADPCDLLPTEPLKLLCEQLGEEPAACTESREQFYENCIVGGVIGEKENMPCNPGSASDIRRKYRAWPGRET
jgi:hypothetical protein